MDSNPDTERFDQYEAELKLVKAELSQKLDQIQEQGGELRKATVTQAEERMKEAGELIKSLQIAKASLPASAKAKVSKSLHEHEADVRGLSRSLSNLSSDRAALFGSRYTDDPSGAGGDEQLEQRQQLLSGTDRLNRSSNRLRESQRIANDTEQIGAGTLQDLATQRETIEHTRDNLLESEGYTDRSIKTLRGMARRMATNRLITIAIITVLVILIIAVIVSKFR
ncbi:MAG: hypothetical protein M1831_002285 [Alyxoria varia]|nr:MAG: hypothetical protein M1831_002285 [Alyxoria varia]